MDEDSSPEPMKYSMLGTDDRSMEEKLAKYAGQVAWSYLEPHYRLGNLYFVDPALALNEVGAAFSENRTEDVKAWLKSGDLVRIEELHARHWEGSGTLFDALVVSPFVLCRPVSQADVRSS